MSECFQSFEYVAPHHHVAQACVHGACSKARLSEKNGQTQIECFERCTHHIATRVAKDDWSQWAELLSKTSCDGEGNPGGQLDHLGCTDKALWDDMTSTIGANKVSLEQYLKQSIHLFFVIKLKCS